jgi:type VI secretion system protein ImpC
MSGVPDKIVAMRGFVETSIDVDEETEERPLALRLDDGDQPFRILIAGNFSGRHHHRGEARETHRPMLVDPDTFDDVIASLKPAVTVALAGEEQVQVPIEFRSLDDFHPDSLYRKLPLFRALHSAKERLASARWKPSAEPVEPAKPSEPVSSPAAPPEGNLLDAILSQQTPQSAPVAENGSSHAKILSDREWSRMIDRIVAPHVSPVQDPRQKQAVKAVDAEIEQKMRAILHDPGFQKVEAAWRAVDFLLRRIETGSELSIHVLDFSYEDFLKDAAPSGDIENSQLYKLLVQDGRGTIGSRRWNLVVGLYQLAPHAGELQALARMASLARKARAPFLAGGAPQFVGAASFDKETDPRQWKEKMEDVAAGLWRDLRHDPESQWVGLAMPRFLLRLPYGKNTSSVDEFDFEELPGQPSHPDYLWGNPAVACACAIASGSLELTRMPLHTFKVDGEPEMTPCAEMWFSDRSIDRFVNAGIMGLASVKNSDSIRLLRLQSINADNPKLGAAGEAASE